MAAEQRMTVRRALEMIGVDRVRLAMESFNHPSVREWCHCFCGEAFSAERQPGDGYTSPIDRWQFGGVTITGGRWLAESPDVIERMIERCGAITCLSMSYEGVAAPWGLGLVSRDELYAEAVRFLAEHGAAVEPTVAVAAEVAG